MHTRICYRFVWLWGGGGWGLQTNVNPTYSLVDMCQFLRVFGVKGLTGLSLFHNSMHGIDAYGRHRRFNHGDCIGNTSGLRCSCLFPRCRLGCRFAVRGLRFRCCGLRLWFIDSLFGGWRFSFAWRHFRNV